MKAFFLLTLVLLALAEAANAKDGNPVYNPADGMVPDEQTAIRIAEAVWIPIYGEDHVLLEEPYMATLKGNLWEVTSVSQAAITEGPYSAQIAKSDGRILSISHGK